LDNPASSLQSLAVLASSRAWPKLQRSVHLQTTLLRSRLASATFRYVFDRYTNVWTIGSTTIQIISLASVTIIVLILVLQNPTQLWQLISPLIGL
jgi:hypothetical protein